jgi:hypothetical protein
VILVERDQAHLRLLSSDRQNFEVEGTAVCPQHVAQLPPITAMP